MILIYAIYKAGEYLPDAQAAMRPSLPRISCRASNSDSLYPTGGESLPAVQAAVRPSLLRISCLASNSDSLFSTAGGSLPLAAKGVLVSANSTVTPFSTTPSNGAQTPPRNALLKSFSKHIKV